MVLFPRDRTIAVRLALKAQQDAGRDTYILTDYKRDKLVKGLCVTAQGAVVEFTETEQGAAEYHTADTLSAYDLAEYTKLDDTFVPYHLYMCCSGGVDRTLNPREATIPCFGTEDEARKKPRMRKCIDGNAWSGFYLDAEKYRSMYGEG